MTVISFTYTNLHNHLIGLAERLALETPPLGDKPTMHTTALGAVVLSAAATEAAINQRVEAIFGPAPVQDRVDRLLTLARKHLEKVRPPHRRLAELAWLKKIEIDWESEPWRSTGDLFRLRNALVHFDSHPVETSLHGRLFEGQELKALARRLELMSIFERGGTWLDVFGNRPCATWATTTARSVLESFNRMPWTRQLGVDP